MSSYAGLFVEGNDPFPDGGLRKGLSTGLDKEGVFLRLCKLWSNDIDVGGQPVLESIVHAQHGRPLLRALVLSHKHHQLSRLLFSCGVIVPNLGIVEWPGFGAILLAQGGKDEVPGCGEARSHEFDAGFCRVDGLEAFHSWRGGHQVAGVLWQEKLVALVHVLLPLLGLCPLLLCASPSLEALPHVAQDGLILFG